jgi:4-amino-4-deoxy-L-arabinose transferase-like glycosyltransferase
MKYDKLLSYLENNSRRMLEFCESHFTLVVILMFILSLAVNVFYTPFDIVLREDAYFYILKAMEIASGDLTPTLTHAIGWPLLIAPFLQVFNVQSVTDAMFFARILSVLFGALSVIPLAFIAKKLLEKKTALVLLSLFVFYPILIISSTTAFTEPLFTFLFLTMILFAIKATDNKRYIFIASAIAGIAYYVRSNGIILLVILLLSFYVMRKQIPDFKKRYLLAIIAIFFLVSGPFLYDRAVEFGSPTYYGLNSKYFADSYQQAWGDNVPVIGPLEYMLTHSVVDYFDKFVIHGGLSIIKDYSFYVLSPIILFFFLYGFLRHFKDNNLKPLSILFIVWFLSFSVVYQVFDTPRHFYATIPFALIFSAFAIEHIFKEEKYKNLSLTLFTLVFVGFSVLTVNQAFYNDQSGNVQDGLEWGQWVSKNIEGKIVIIEGWDLIMMHLPDSKAGGIGIFNVYAPESNITILRPGYFNNFLEAMDWFKETNVTHIVFEEDQIYRRSYMTQIYNNGRALSYLNIVYSNHDTDSLWKVKVYEIDWVEFENKI